MNATKKANTFKLTITPDAVIITFKANDKSLKVIFSMEIQANIPLYILLFCSTSALFYMNLKIIFSYSFSSPSQ